MRISSIRIEGKTLDLSNSDKILFPKSKLTKGDLISYYDKVSDRMIPLIANRPVSMLRYPNGIDQDGFFQKSVSSYFPKWIRRVKVQKGGSSTVEMVLCNDKKALLYLANQACITPHIWLSKKDRIRNPDRMIFDLDPSKTNTFLHVQKTALFLRQILKEEFRLKSYVMTTGSRGLHVVVPLKRTHNFDVVRSFAKEVANSIVKLEPEMYTIEQRIEKREQKLFIDYLRNAYGQTAVAPYAVRPLERGPIATPIDWSELGRGLNSQSFHLKNVQKRLTKKDPWKGMQQLAQSLKITRKKI